MRAVSLSVVLVGVLAAACSEQLSQSSHSAAREWGKCQTLVQIKDPRLNESSGICASREQEGIYYTHNDSGDSARFFKFNRKGEILAIYNVKNAKKAIDWEDIASATIGGKPYIFCGDIGDNKSERNDITIYRIPEPKPSNGAATEINVTADQTYTLTYPDKAHNAETLMVSPATGDIYVVTKAPNKPSRVFKLAHPRGSGSFTPIQIGEIQVGGIIKEGRLITAGDISPDSKHIVLRSYLEAWEFDVPARFDDWFKVTPRRIQTNFEFQGEGICYSRNGRALLTTSEGSPCQVSEAKLLSH